LPAGDIAIRGGEMPSGGVGFDLLLDDELDEFGQRPQWPPIKRFSTNPFVRKDVEAPVHFPSPWPAALDEREIAWGASFLERLLQPKQ